jgi:cytochrome c oxidase subunit I
MHFGIGLVVLFTIGGVSGVTHSVAPSDTQQTDTYYIVAHLHYVLFGGAIFGLFAGFYYWWPKIFARMLNERLGKANFWTMFVGMNMTFGPMHITGLQGQPRRMYVYPEGYGFDFWNLVATVGSFILAVGVLLFLINAFMSIKRGTNVPLDPWDARTLEWMTTNPPKPHNFDVTPQVHSLDEFWHRKYADDHETGEVRQVMTAEEVFAEEAKRHEHIHMPSPSYWPMVVAFGLPVFALGLIFNYVISVVGALILVAGIYGWALEPATADESEHEPDGGTGGAGGSKELAPVV